MVWSVSDIHDDEKYILALCQDSLGRRIPKLISHFADRSKIEGAVIFTAIVPNELLRKRSLDAIARSVTAENGGRFYFTAHGVWLSELESAQFDKGIAFGDMQWVTRTPPSAL